MALLLVFVAAAAPPAARADKRDTATKAPKLRDVRTRAVEVTGDAAATQPDPDAEQRAPKKMDFSRTSQPRADAEREKKLSEKRRALIREIDELLKKAGPRYAARADRLYQKAELEWEEAKYQHYLVLDAFDASSGAPEPPPDFRAAVATYRQILNEHPDFPLADEVRFHLGFALAEQGDEVGAIAVLEELVKKHPKSTYVPDAHVALGELYFGHDDMEAAVAQYALVVKKHREHELYVFSRYKLGWTYYRLQRFEEAVTEMAGAIEDEERRDPKPRLSIRDQALSDLIVVWAETPGGWKLGATYYEKKGGEAMLRKELLRFAKYLIAQDKNDDAVALLTWLTARDPARADVVVYDDLRFDVARRRRRIEAVEAEARRLLEFYAPGGAWDAASGRTAKHRDAARALCEQAALYAAELRHESAQRLTDLAQYRMAAEDYQLYLRRFPTDAHAAVATYRLAEIELVLGAHMDAGAHYLAASTMLTGEPAEDAAYKAVYAYAVAVREAGLADDAVPPPDDDPRKPPPTPVALGVPEKALIAAADAFVARLPAAEDAPEVRFIAGRVLYLRLHLDDAAKRFVDLVAAHPKASRAADGAALALDCYNRLRRWPELVAWARKMIAEKRFEHYDDRALHEIVSGASAQAAYDLEVKGDLAGAAAVLLAVVDDNPRSPKNPERLLLAATYLSRAGDLVGAEKAYRRLLDKHPQTQAAARAAFALGAIYEARGDLAGAAGSYERAADLPRVDGSADALYNAALLYETLGEGKKAAQLYDRYARDFADRDDAPEIAFRAAAALETGGEPDAARERYLGFAKKWPKARVEVLVEAAARGCELLAKRDAKKGRAACQAALQAAARAGVMSKPGSAMAAAAARAQLAIADLAAAEMDAVKLELPEATLVRRFDEKLKKLMLAAEAYLAVTMYGVPSWGALAIVRIGEAYQRFAGALRAAPEPPGLEGERLEAYRAQLGDQAASVEESALEFFAQVADLATGGTVTPATAAAAAAHRKLDPAVDPWMGEGPAVITPRPALRVIDPWRSAP